MQIQWENMETLPLYIQFMDLEEFLKDFQG